MLESAQGGPWLLLIIGAAASAAPLLVRSGRTQVPSLILTVWFALGALIGLATSSLPIPKPIFILALGLVALLAAYVTYQGRSLNEMPAKAAHFANIVPFFLAVIGIFVNLSG